MVPEELEELNLTLGRWSCLCWLVPALFLFFSCLSQAGAEWDHQLSKCFRPHPTMIPPSYPREGILDVLERSSKIFEFLTGTYRHHTCRPRCIQKHFHQNDHTSLTHAHADTDPHNSPRTTHIQPANQPTKPTNKIIMPDKTH